MRVCLPMVGKAMQHDSVTGYRRQDFHFDLPPGLIADNPAQIRDHSRLLELRGSEIRHRRFDQLGELLHPGDLLVVNNTRVLKARMQAVKDSGGSAELLLERIENERCGLFQVRVSKALKPGRELLLADGARLQVLARVGDFYRLAFPQDLLEVLERVGSVPLPPYIQRAAEPVDEERYQTVYGREPGAVAAPTAGLHFTRALLTQLSNQGVGIAEVTLHVGAGTFQPVRSDIITDHVMHAESYHLTAQTAALIAQTRANGGRVVAVGTTVVRTLEAASATGELIPGWNETRIFITPGYRFRVVDALITNFHLPESTLLMLVCAFGGYEPVMSAYQLAVRQGYRFFSYGDAMFIERKNVI